jgi:hypothetical protein
MLSTARATLVAAPVIATLGLLAPRPGAAVVFNLALEDTDIYRVGYEELLAAGLEGTTPSATLGLSAAGQPVPLWVEDGGDGVFGPSDHLEFLGRRLEGEASHFNEFSRFNVYRLDTETAVPAHATPAAPTVVNCRQTGLLDRRHLEEDALRVRFRPLVAARPEIWFWARLAHSDEEPFELSLALEDLDPKSGVPVRLRLHFKGWSSRPYKGDDGTTDHEIELWLGERLRHRGAWNNSEAGYLLEGIELSAEELTAADGRLRLKVPRRKDADGAVVDVSLLNWLEVEYPRRSEVTSRLLAVRPLAGSASACAFPTGVESAVLFTADGRRAEIPGGVAVEIPAASVPAAGEPAAWLALGDLRRVEHVERDVASRLLATDRQADYVMIAHPTLLEPAGELARFHRERGLTVALVDVTDVYDEFNRGVVHPRAIRDFLAHAYGSWREPRPRFVLLVGDASWDLSDEPADDANYASMSFELATTYGFQGRRSPGDHRFSRQKVRAYDETAPAVWRNLIPTWDHRTVDGPAASDNWFVDVEGDDLRPEMAIGRLPVASPKDVRAIVEKTIATARRIESAGESEGSLAALLATDHYAASMNHADTVADHLERAGFATTRIYPRPDAAGAGQVGSLVEAFDAAPDLVYFVGHGGRYEWRTGRADLAGQTDLFTLDHVDQLAEQMEAPLAVVLSVACYSAPFDHPSADSIGEKLLRVKGRGAAAVVAAAWRITPSVATGQALVDALMLGGTLGEALLEVKKSSRDFQFIVQFNLLGDPALPLAGWLRSAGRALSHHHP